MTTYEFPSTVAMDPTLNTLVTDGQGFVYALSDPGFTSPLVAKDRLGTEMNGVRTTYNGVTEEFFVDDQPIVWWSSGPYSFMIVSFTSLVEAANTAASAAQAARIAAESATAPGDTVVAGYISSGTSQTRGALNGVVNAIPTIPAGGAAGQVLAKSSNNDYNIAWVDPAAGGGGAPATVSFSDITGQLAADQAAYGSVMFALKSGSTWPARPTSRVDVCVLWIGADPSPVIIDSGTGGMLRNVDIRMVTV